MKTGFGKRGKKTMRRTVKILTMMLVATVLAGICMLPILSSSVTDSDWIEAPPTEQVKCLGGDCDHTECDYVYSFAVVGDTQNLNYIDAQNYTKAKEANPSLTYADYTQAHMRTLYNWILDNKESKNIQYVLGVGDITDSPSPDKTYFYDEWGLANEAISMLNGKVGYSLVKGNHDRSENLNENFGVGSQYYADLSALAETLDSEGRPMAGFLDPAKIEDTYRKINVCGDKYIIFTLGYYPTEECVEWLNRILAENPDYTAIITLHAFLYSDRAFLKPSVDGVYPRQLWEEALSLHENVKMVLCGHVNADDVVVNRMQGKNGNTVHFILTDAQRVDETIEPVGMVTMFYMSADGRVMNVEYISTVREAEGENAYLKEKNQFEILLDYSTDGGSGWTATKYGNIPTVDLDSNIFHVFLDDDGVENTDNFHYGSFNTWEEALNTVHSFNESGELEDRKVKTYYILMTGDYTHSGGTASKAIGDNPSKVVLDINGNTLTVSETGVFLPIYNVSLKYTASFTVKNGNVVMAGSKSFALFKLSKKDNGSLIDVSLEELNVTWNGSKAPIADISSGYEGYKGDVALTVRNCVIDTTGAIGAVTVFDLDDTYNNCDVALRLIGGEIKGTTLGNTDVYSADTGADTAVYGKGEDGEYPILMLNEKAEISGDFKNESGVALQYITDSASSPYVYRLAERSSEDEEGENIIAEGECGVDTFWRLNDKGVITLYGNGSTYYYTGKGMPWYAHKSQITKIVVEEGIVSVGASSFYEFTNVTEIVLPEGLRAIGQYAFYGCSSVKTLNVPASVYYVGNYAFRKLGETGNIDIIFADKEDWYRDGEAVSAEFMADASAVTNDFRKVSYTANWSKVSENPAEVASGTCGKTATWVLDSNGTLTISGTGYMTEFLTKGAPWFNFNAAIVNVLIEEGIKKVGKCSFYGADNILSVQLPESLEIISPYAFYYCRNLKEIDIPANVTTIGQYALRQCKGLATIDLGVKYGWSAGDLPISSAELAAESAVRYFTKAYYSVDWTRNVNAEDDSDESIVAAGICGDSLKWRLDILGTLTVSGAGEMDNYSSDTEAIPWNQYKDQIACVVIEEGVTSVGKCAFYEYGGITEISLPSTLLSICEYAFCGCEGVVSLTIPAGVSSIGKYAFRRLGEAGITELIFENTVGWSCGGILIESSFFADPRAVAASIRGTAYAEAWTR